MKSVLAALIGIVTAASVSIASAHVVIVTTSIPVATAMDEDALHAALGSAIDDAVAQTIGFTPTAMVLTNLHRIGSRIYLEFLILDQAGEEMIRELAGEAQTLVPDPGPEEPTAPIAADPQV
jgi:hypothetical protein